MMTQIDCERAEVLAGAIALDEADDAERSRYRAHLSRCAACVSSLGGERAIEATMQAVARARDAESWQPELVRPWQARRTRTWTWAPLALVGALSAVVIGLWVVHPAARLAGAARVARTTTTRMGAAQRPAMRVAVARLPQHAVPVVPHAAPLRVAHHVVDLRVPATRATARPAAPVVRRLEPAPRIVAMAPDRRDEASLGAMRTTRSAIPAYRHQAESIALVPRSIVIRDVGPLRGHGVRPDPPLIAAAQLRNEGLDAATTVYEVSVDARGVPTHCTITKSSGILAIDDAVCAAAMAARFHPRTVNGTAIASRYRDAFVFLAPGGS